MDRGEIEVEEERRVKMKRMPALPTNRENHDNESAHVANRSQCKTEDSREHLENESSVPRVAMDRGFLAHGTDADLVTYTEAPQRGGHPSGVPRRSRASCSQLCAGKP